ncbi:MAG: hypothetical protein WA700_11830 [Acidobacteriaceae bacterium]
MMLDATGVIGMASSFPWADRGQTIAEVTEILNSAGNLRGECESAVLCCGERTLRHGVQEIE